MSHIRQIAWAEVEPNKYGMKVQPITAVSSATAKESFYLATSDRISVALGGNIRGTLENPAGSDKNLYIVKLVAVKEQTGFIYSDFFMNPTSGLPTTTIPSVNTVMGSQNSANGIVNIDSGGTALSGGLDLGLHMAVSQGRSEIELPPIVVPPGVTIGVNIPIGSLESGNGQFAMYWFEG